MKIRIDSNKYKEISKRSYGIIDIDEGIKLNSKITLTDGSSKGEYEIIYIDGSKAIISGMYRTRSLRSARKLGDKLDRMHKYRDKYIEIYELAKQYYDDAIYYLKIGDYFTSFGCSDYAYGILDAIENIEKVKEELNS